MFKKIRVVIKLKKMWSFDIRNRLDNPPMAFYFCWWRVFVKTFYKGIMFGSFRALENRLYSGLDSFCL